MDWRYKSRRCYHTSDTGSNTHVSQGTTLGSANGWPVCHAFRWAIYFAAVAVAAGLPAIASRPAAGQTVAFETGRTLYENPLSEPEDIKRWVLESSKEGHPAITFPHGRIGVSS